MKTDILATPTNIITGFLGVGKTSAILHLLKEKPENERWAILVNEFGEIGVDGSLFTGKHSTEQGVFIREVPGGCMCCSSGLPMQIALNQLLIQAKPDRLLIEPTGLGHPIEVLQILSDKHYRDILDLQKVLTLVDARKLSDKRYTEHQIFNQQIAVADIIVGNKLDLYQNEDKRLLEHYVKQYGNNHAQLIFAQHGEITTEHLAGKTAFIPQTQAHHHHHKTSKQKSLAAEATIPKSGHIKAVNQGENFHSIGWRFSPTRIFNYKKLPSFLNSINAERIKAVFITEQGIFGYNLTGDTANNNLTITELDDCIESRIEIITDTNSDTTMDEWEAQLMACRISHQ